MNQVGLLVLIGITLANPFVGITAVGIYLAVKFIKR